jgi:myo-inositol-1(or 4)-monophosphatase
LGVNVSDWGKRLGLSADLQAALKATFCAADAIYHELNGMGNRIDFNDKAAGKGIVTAFDELSEKVLREELSSSTSYSFLGEEGGLSESMSSSKRWVVDPIDGTTNFAFDYSFSAISIALKAELKFILGVVYELRTRDVFFAETGKGAYKNGEPIRVSHASRYGDQPVIFLNNGYSLASKKRAGTQLMRLAPVIGDFRKFGTTAYELACVASGRAAAFIASGDEVWDYAAAAVIVKEAGGLLTDWQGEPFEFQSSYLIASNGDAKLHRQLVEASKDLQKNED